MDVLDTSLVVYLVEKSVEENDCFVLLLPEPEVLGIYDTALVVVDIFDNVFEETVCSVLVLAELK